MVIAGLVDFSDQFSSVGDFRESFRFGVALMGAEIKGLYLA